MALAPNRPIVRVLNYDGANKVISDVFIRTAKFIAAHICDAADPQVPPIPSEAGMCDEFLDVYIFDRATFVRSLTSGFSVVVTHGLYTVLCTWQTAFLDYKLIEEHARAQ